MEKSSLTATQAILYFDSIATGDRVVVKYRLRAKYSIRTPTFKSRVYECYDPLVRAVAWPVLLEGRHRQEQAQTWAPELRLIERKAGIPLS